jgi:programmed cell death protein 5
MDEELEKLRKKRLRELQQSEEIKESMVDQEEQQREFEEKKKMILRSILTPKAKERLGNIKVARPEMAEAIENQLIAVAQSGSLKNKINDEQLLILLSKIIPKKRDIKIKRR